MVYYAEAAAREARDEMRKLRASFATVSAMLHERLETIEKRLERIEALLAEQKRLE